MISNHYPLAFASRWNWLIVALVVVIGVTVRHFYNSRHAHKPSPWWTWAVAAAAFLAIVLLSGQQVLKTAAATPADGVQKAAFADVQEIVISRCSMCHAAEPVWDGVGVAPKGVMLETPEQIRQHARAIWLQAVATHAMPPGGNVTELSDEDRGVLAAWVQAGAPGP
jgi:uncharacterized membrane protein